MYECRSAEEVVDLLAGGQGVFGIAVGGAFKEMQGRWRTCRPSGPSPRRCAAAEPTAADELGSAAPRTASA